MIYMQHYFNPQLPHGQTQQLAVVMIIIYTLILLQYQLMFHSLFLSLYHLLLHRYVLMVELMIHCKVWMCFHKIGSGMIHQLKINLC